MTALIVAQGVVLVFLAILVVGLLRSHADILHRLHDMGAGDPDEALLSTAAPFRTGRGVVSPRGMGVKAPDIAGSDPAGGAVAISVAGPAKTLLAFMSTTCATCENLWRSFQQPSVRQSLGDVRLVIVTKGSRDEIPTAVADLAPPGVPLVMSSGAWEEYKVPGSPYFVMAQSGLVAGEGSAGTWDKLLDLIRQADGDVPMEHDHGHGRDRTDRVDQELADSGIEPGDPRLYGDQQP